ncbi:MAG: DNA polymerase I [Alistipes sp.]|nr:DNA polymerase I [Alistipes sp.]MBQ8367395.1 DNA polymerase I [Alistipes sp.]
MTEMRKTLYLVDAYALIFKYYYAFMGRPMRNREGLNTSVVFGFTKFLRDILRREKPDLIGVAFDPPGGCFRREMFAEYKANRPPTPEDIKISVPYVKRLLEAMNIPILEVAGFEADDVIGTLAKRGAEAGYSVFMVSPDKDYGQLVDDNCVIYKQKGDATEIVDRAAIEAKYGFTDPVLVRDMLALWGDSSDNIPGVPGIGEKGATKLVREWGTAENILANAEKIGGKTGKNIAEWGEKLLLSKDLTTIRLDVPIALDEVALQVSEPNYTLLRGLYAELNFSSFLRDIENVAPIEATPTQPTQAPQIQLQEVARAKAEAKRRASLEGQGDLFAMMSAPAPVAEVAEPIVEESAGMQTIATTPHDYRTVHGAEELRELCAYLVQFKEFCFDTETTGLDPITCRIVGMSFSAEPFKAWYVPFPADSTKAEEYIEILRPLFEDDSIAKIGQNIKFDLMVLRGLGIKLRGRKIDTMLLHYIIDAESRHNMNFLAERYLNYTPIAIEALIGKGAKQLTMDMVGVERVAEYAAEDADVTLRLKEVLFREVEQLAMTKLYFDIEEPMIDVLADMELEGVCIDVAKLRDYAVGLRAMLQRLEDEVRALADEPTLNINSSRQLGEVLFAKLRITEKPKMTKMKQFSTEEEYLQGFAHDFPIVGKVLEYRGVKKLLSTYVDALPELVNRITGRIHTSYNQAVTATGRLSSTNPNLQNIPIRDDLGKPIREAFIASDADHVLVAADYSQIELRLMAHLSGDEALIDAFKRGDDIHSATAARLFHKSTADVTSDERRRAKTANFGIIYGISAFGLAQRLDIPNREAKELIENYFASYPAVKAYMDRAIQQAATDGYVETMFGRRRTLHDITSSNRTVRGVAERNAINAPIQGSAADIMKLAMIEIYRRFKAEGIRSKMIMQVHDEVVIDTLRAELDAVKRIVKEAMESVATLRVALIAEVNSGDCWLEAH